MRKREEISYWESVNLDTLKVVDDEIEVSSKVSLRQKILEGGGRWSLEIKAEEEAGSSPLNGLSRGSSLKYYPKPPSSVQWHFPRPGPHRPSHDILLPVN